MRYMGKGKVTGTERRMLVTRDSGEEGRESNC